MTKFFNKFKKPCVWPIFGPFPDPIPKKHTDRQKDDIPSAILHSRPAKNTRKMCQIYSQLPIKTPEQRLVLLLLTLNIFCTLLYR